jgi:hypothetical protein
MSASNDLKVAVPDTDGPGAGDVLTVHPKRK